MGMSMVFLTRTRVLRLGEVMYLIKPALDGARQMTGYVSRFQTGRFVLRLEEPLTDWDGRFVFVVNDEEVRLVSTGTVSQLVPPIRLEVSCHPASAWREIAVERRVLPRYATNLEAVISGGADAGTAGTIVNISEGGCDFATLSPLSGTSFDLLINYDSFSSQISCVQAGEQRPAEYQGIRLLHHLGFRSVNPSQRAFLRMILDDHQMSRVELRNELKHELPHELRGTG